MQHMHIAGYMTELEWEWVCFTALLCNDYVALCRCPFQVSFLAENELPQNGTFGKDGQKVEEESDVKADTSSSASSSAAASSSMSPPPTKKQCADTDGIADSSTSGASGSAGAGAGAGVEGGAAVVTEAEKVSIEASEHALLSL